MINLLHIEEVRTTTKSNLTTHRISVVQIQETKTTLEKILMEKTKLRPRWRHQCRWGINKKTIISLEFCYDQVCIDVCYILKFGTFQLVSEVRTPKTYIPVCIVRIRKKSLWIEENPEGMKSRDVCPSKAGLKTFSRNSLTKEWPRFTWHNFSILAPPHKTVLEKALTSPWTFGERLDNLIILTQRQDEHLTYSILIHDAIVVLCS